MMDDEIVCPYCGYEHGDCFERDDSGMTPCDVCGRPFFFQRHIDVSYSSLPLMGPHQQSDWDREQELLQLAEREE